MKNATTADSNTSDLLNRFPGALEQVPDTEGFRFDVCNGELLATDISNPLGYTYVWNRIPGRWSIYED